MTLTLNRVQSLGWAFVLTVCVALTVILTLRVDAVKGQVRETENRIVSLQQSIRFLEVEFQTRANQQQLAALNNVEFGYSAPGARQYVEGERQLAALGAPRAAGAPKPIRVAHAVAETEAMAFAAMVSPMTGKRSAADGGTGRADSAGVAGAAGETPKGGHGTAVASVGKPTRITLSDVGRD